MQKRIGNYCLVDELGKGQFGVVYKAFCVDRPREIYAVKCIPKSIINKSKYMERLFETETSLMFRLDSPHIMRLFEINETMNNYYLVMTYCDGGDLELLLSKLGRFPEPVVRVYLRHLAAGFRVLVANNVMHRDIKLANLFLHGGELVIGDLGFCRAGAALTSTQLGTPLTMSPEMLFCHGEVEYDNRTDLWSIGIVLYQMLYGCFPFEPATAQELMHMVQHQSGDALVFPAEAEVSPGLQRLIRSLLQFEPARRISWEEFFAHELTAPELPAPDVRDNSDALSRDVRCSLPSAELEEPPAAVQVDPIRFCAHEEAKLKFLTDAVRRLRLAAENPLVKDGSAPLLLLASVALFHKALAKFQHAVRGLEGQSLSFSPNDLQVFLTSSNFKGALAGLQDTLRINKSLYEVVLARAMRELKDPQLREKLQRCSQLSYDELGEADRLLQYIFEELRNVVARIDCKKQGIDELRSALLLLHVSVHDVKFLRFDAEGHFDWETFRSSLDQQQALRVLN